MEYTPGKYRSAVNGFVSQVDTVHDCENSPQSSLPAAVFVTVQQSIRKTPPSTVFSTTLHRDFLLKKKISFILPKRINEIIIKQKHDCQS